MYIGYPVLPGWKERGREILQILTVQQIFREEKEASSYSPAHYQFHLCNGHDSPVLPSLRIQQCLYTTVREPFTSENTS